MTFSYVGPQTGAKDEVRFLIGDTNEAMPYLSDEEIDWLLSQAGNSVTSAAMAACDRVLIGLAAMVDESVGEVSISFSQQAAAYEKVYARLTRRANLRGCGPITGGISRAGKRMQDRDADRVKPLFCRGGSELREENGARSGDVGYPLGLGNVGPAYGDAYGGRGGDE